MAVVLMVCERVCVGVGVCVGEWRRDCLGQSLLSSPLGVTFTDGALQKLELGNQLQPSSIKPELPLLSPFPGHKLVKDTCVMHALQVPI